jgi:hypothetical protein
MSDDIHENDRQAGHRAQLANRPAYGALLDGEITTKTEERECRDCGVGFQGSVMYVGTTRTFGIMRCPDCLNRHAESEKAAQTPARTPQDACQAAFESICPPEYRNSDPKRIIAELKARGSKPSRLDHCGKLEHISVEVAVAEILAWDVTKKGLGLVGAPGRCKTRLMFQMLKPHILRGVQVRAIHAAKLSRSMSAAYEDGARAAETWLAEWAAVPVLLIDDLDKGRFTEAVLVDFYGMMEDRKAFLRPTCFTSNATGKQIEERLQQEAGRRQQDDTTGASLTRRLRAMANSYTL